MMVVRRLLISWSWPQARGRRQALNRGDAVFIRAEVSAVSERGHVGEKPELRNLPGLLQLPRGQRGGMGLQIVALAMPPFALSTILIGGLRGAGDTRWPLVFTLVGFVGVRIPLAYYFAWQSVSVPLLGIVISAIAMPAGMPIDLRKFAEPSSAMGTVPSDALAT